MAAPRSEPNEPRPFAALGISAEEERVYRWLLTHRRASAADVAHALALSSPRTQHLLDSIEAKGLTTHSPERPRRYMAVSPAMAIETLVLQRQSDLERAQSAAIELQRETEAMRPHDEREQVVELITSREGKRQAFEQMQWTAQQEVVCLIRAPILVSRLDLPDSQDQKIQRKIQARGVCYRSIVDTEFLSLPGARQRTWDDIKAGEAVRVVSNLPFKMLLADRRIALIPLNIQQPHSPSLLVRSSALLDALYALFEVFWKEAAPISIGRRGDLDCHDPEVPGPEERESLLALMTAGLNDKRIAHELGISASTLTRRIAAIMQASNARTRFQLGCLVTGPACAPRDRREPER